MRVDNVESSLWWMKSVELVSLARRRRFYVVAREAVSTLDSITWPKFLTCPHINFSAIIQWILSRGLFVLSTVRNERNDKTDRSIRSVIPMSKRRYYRDFFDSSYLEKSLWLFFFYRGWLSSTMRHDETLRDAATMWKLEFKFRTRMFVHI